MKSLGSLRLKAYNEDEVRRYRSIEERFVCSICADIKTTVDDLKLHYINVHGYKSPIQPLPVTSSPSAERDFFNESSESTTSSQAESIPKQSYYSEKVCSICRMVLKNSKTLSKHIKFVHNKIKSFQCSVCSKQFSRKATLEIHSRQHLSDETAKNSYACPECQFRAADPSVMAKHKKLHQKGNDGKYKCLSESCNFYAIQATGLKNHIKRKHPEIVTMKCTYPQCKFVSVNPERLKRHKSDHERGLVQKEKIEENPKIHEVPKPNLNSSEISSDCFLPIESTDSIANHADTGGVTIIHNNSSSTTNIPGHSEDTQF